MLNSCGKNTKKNITPSSSQQEKRTFKNFYNSLIININVIACD